MLHKKLSEKKIIIAGSEGLLGNEISTLINDKLSTWKNSIEWDASNHSTGMYFIKLECANYFKIRKMLLLK